MRRPQVGNSSARGLRAAYQFLVGCLVAVPVIVGALPDGVRLGPLNISAIAGIFLVADAAAVKVLNELEDRGIVPPFLKAATMKPPVRKRRHRRRRADGHVPRPGGGRPHRPVGRSGGSEPGAGGSDTSQRAAKRVGKRAR